MNSERKDMQDPGDFLRFEQLKEYLEFFETDLQILDYYA